MVTVKVRETYDLHTVKNKMTLISIHTPKPDIIKKNYPGLLVQCRAYRPKSCSVRLACASVLPLDPKGVGLSEGDVAPEDVFNPILYKAMSNKGMSQLEARINALGMGVATGTDIEGLTADVDVDSLVPGTDDFGVYYALLANTHEWKHAHPQQGLSMSRLRPLVYEMVYNVGDMSDSVFAGSAPPSFSYPSNTGIGSGDALNCGVKAILGKAKEMPFIPCTSYSYDESVKADGGYSAAGFGIDGSKGIPANCSIDVPYLPVVCGCIIVPPSRLHELFFRFVCEWEIEFSTIRPLSDITNWTDLARYGASTHYQNYSYEATKEAITGDKSTILDNDQTMVSANVPIEKVM